MPVKNQKEKNDQLLERLAYAVGLYNPSKNCLINITCRPSKILESQYFSIKNIQTKLNLLYYELSKDLDSYSFDEPFYNFLNSIYLEKKKYKSDIVALFVRSDYLLDGDHYKQVEINTISQCFVSFGPLLNKIHSQIYPNVVVSEVDKKFINFIIKLKSLYESKNVVKNTVIAMVDVDTSINTGNYMEKVQLINLLLIHNVHLRFVTLEELTVTNSIVNIQDEEVSVVYYRWYYNFEHYTNESKELRRQIELSKAISLPSVEFQMINSKLFQVVLSDKAALRKYTKDEDEIHNFFGDFIANKTLFDELNLNKKDWLEKSVDEGGNSINKSKSNSIYMKKFISPTVKNSFLTDNVERDVINEVSIFGSLIATDNRILQNSEDGYIVRSKDEKNLEGGICSGNGGLDSLELIN